MTRPVSAWSRRRAAVAAEAEAEQIAADDAVVARQHAELSEKSEEEVLEALGLPNPDELVMGDDFKAFMAKSVPAYLRKRALRTLWRSNPVLACVDGLNDYDDDYLTGSVGQGPIKTTYQVGKGMLAHLLEVERQKEAKSAEEPQAVPEPEIEDTEPEPVDQPEVLEADVTEEETIEPSMPRRMQFQFEGDHA